MLTVFVAGGIPWWGNCNCDELFLHL